MLGLKCFPVILLINVICNEFLHVSGTHQCLTWDLYRGEIIRFTCRVSNFVKPITLTDNHGKLFAQCTFYERQKSCQPSNSFVRVNYTTNEVVFYVDRASLWEYDGEWSCHIGREILISKVAISKGIINEINVRLEGIMRKTNMIELTCSSCKTPVSHNAEFRINGRSEDSLFYDGRSGNCMHHGVPCQPDVCGCSASGSEFFMLYTMNSSIHVSFSCDLIFLDPVTSAKFSKTATIEQNGTVYKPTKTITKIIKPGKSRSDTRVSSQPGNTGTTVVIDDLGNSTDGNDKHGKDDKGYQLLQWVLIGLCLFFVIGLTMFSLKKKCRKILGKLSHEKSKKQLHEDSPEALVLYPLLENGDNLSHESSKKQPLEDTPKALVEIPVLENDDNMPYKNSKTKSHKVTSKALVETPPVWNDGEGQSMTDRQSTMANAEENTCRDIEVYASFDKRYKSEPRLHRGKQTRTYQPKSRISFPTTDRELSFYQRKTKECYLCITV